MEGLGFFIFQNSLSLNPHILDVTPLVILLATSGKYCGNRW
jgi:hypothetical protein